MRRRAPRGLATALEHLQSEWAPPTLLGAVQRVWPEVVGEGIAREAEPAAEREGVVTVTCSSALWAHELDLMSPGIVDGLNAAVGTGLVRRLRCQSVAPRGRR